MYYPYGDKPLTEVQNTIATMCAKQYSEYLFKYPGVIGMMRANKIKGGKYTGVDSITFLVEEKISSDKLSNEKLLPKTINNIQTDVIATGKLIPHSLNKSSEYNNYKPNSIRFGGGNKIGPVKRDVIGTFGCVVEDEAWYYLLSSNHVLSDDNTLSTHWPINGYDRVPPYQAYPYVATLINNVKVNFFNQSSTSYPENKIDAALGMVGSKANKKLLFEKFVFPGVIDLGNITGTSTVSLEDKVIFLGCKSGAKQGTVWGLNATVIVEYSSSRKALFTNQIITSKMSQPGDSGSVGMVQATMGKLFGLLFAGTAPPAASNISPISIYNPIDTVLSTFKVKPTLSMD